MWVALVDHLDANSVTVTLTIRVRCASGRLIVQAGAFERASVYRLD